MRRRDFIVGLGGATAAWPLHADAQPAIPMIGYLALASSPNARASFRQDLNEAGYIEGRDVGIVFRSANNQAPLLRELAADLVRSQVAVIVTMDGVAMSAAKAATSTIPIVFATNLDPVKLGLVASLNQPGSNMTGAAVIGSELLGKQLDLLRQMVPRGTIFGYLSDRFRTSEEMTGDIVAASRALGTELVVAEARSRSAVGAVAEARSRIDIDIAFETLVQRRIGALVVAPAVLFDINSDRILRLAARNKIPAMYSHPGWVRRGGLMSYGASFAGTRKVVVDYVVRILKGAKPADLPVQRPTAFDLVINLKTAEALGLTVPPTLLVLATELID
jgi:putative tryptophan/tyrosine transport system substrate-binding protein